MNSATTEDRTSASLAALAVFIALVVGAGGLISSGSAPSAWYAALSKSPLTPPSWVFAPVWSALYALIALAGWRVWVNAPRSRAMQFWILQMLLNWAWSPALFVAHRPWLAFFILVAMWISIASFMFTARKHTMVASALFAPYLAWVTFAGYLNLAMALQN